MAKRARELAELLEYKVIKNHKGCYDLVPPSSFSRPPYSIRQIDFVESDAPWSATPDFDTDLNAMREVWKVLWEKGLWLRFTDVWFAQQTWKDSHEGWFYTFLNDLPGQVEAAIKVLKALEE